MSQKKKTVKIVKKPFLRGKVFDRDTVKSALKFFAATLGMAVANLMMGSMLMWEAAWMTKLFNGLLLLLAYMLFYQGGANKGTAAVNHGEIMYQRKEAGKTVSAADEALGFHSVKGIVNALLGSIPMLICAVILACVAQRQMSGIGALPGWIKTFQRRSEIGEALAFYNNIDPMTLEDSMRLVIRMLLMPLVNIIGIENKEGILRMEQLSVFPLLLPALSYGLGYLRGTDVRTGVHTAIAAGKRKRARKEKKRRQARMNTSKGPEQLN